MRSLRWSLPACKGQLQFESRLISKEGLISGGVNKAEGSLMSSVSSQQQADPFTRAPSSSSSSSAGNGSSGTMSEKENSVGYIWLISVFEASGHYSIIAEGNCDNTGNGVQDLTSEDAQHTINTSTILAPWLWNKWSVDIGIRNENDIIVLSFKPVTSDHNPLSVYKNSFQARNCMLKGSDNDIKSFFSYLDISGSAASMPALSEKSFHDSLIRPIAFAVHNDPRATMF